MSTNIVNDHQHEEEEQEIYWEECSCGVHLGGKLFHDADEFEEHPDRERGYNARGEWRCEECRFNDENDNDDSEDEEAHERERQHAKDYDTDGETTDEEDK